VRERRQEKGHFTESRKSDSSRELVTETKATTERDMKRGINEGGATERVIRPSSLYMVKRTTREIVFVPNSVGRKISTKAAYAPKTKKMYRGQPMAQAKSGSTGRNVIKTN